MNKLPRSRLFARWFSRRHFRRHFIEVLEPRCVLTLTVPALSSLPGANHTILLDFDGHVTTNTEWNTYDFDEDGDVNPLINSPGYDIDGNATSFSSTELTRIEEAWKRVSEDYIPFNVNVTTVDPGVEALRKSGASDTRWGIRVVITADTEGSEAGGIAYIDSFNWNTDTPAFVYVTGAKSVAEAVSHEAGHSLGLDHDGASGSEYYSGHGSGNTSWAPIMGLGYYNSVTTWDRGEFFGATNRGSSANFGEGSDDLAVITTLNGFGYRNDDHGNTNATASALAVSGTSVSGSGIIERTTDIDVFRFSTAAGLVTLDISPFTPGPNLDVKASLYNSGGTLVATSNPSDVLNASFSLILTAGQYYVSIDGTGVGSPTTSSPTGYTDYASLGRYFVTGTIIDLETLPLPELTINDVTVNEDAGTATFTVSLIGTLTGAVSVNYATVNNSAVAGSDFTAKSGSLTFSLGGSTTRSVTVSILNDTAVESTENFFVNLSTAVGATIIDAQGRATITD
ncbi:MAG: hypothetical protein IAG10_28395, partial [Planctomycetaceae bacterium]|nr:hypothetical protein [Planctomycetaceae bacterium]